MPFIPQGYLSNPGIEFLSPASPALTCGFFTTEPPGKPIAGKYFKGLMKIINNMTVGLFLFPAKCAQFGSSKARELKIIRMKKFLEVIYDVWLSPANFVLNDMPIICSGGYWLFCPVAISLPYGNIFYDFLWKANLPHHIIAFAGAESTATQSSLWGKGGTHRSAVFQVQHPPTHSNEIKPEQGWNPTGRDIFIFLLELLGKRLYPSTGLAKALDWKQREAGIHLWHKQG